MNPVQGGIDTTADGAMKPGGPLHTSTIGADDVALGPSSVPLAEASGKASSRLAWTIADQVLSSGTNFALGILIARTVSVHSFGVFTLIFATYQIASGIARALVSEPLVVRFTSGDLLSHKKHVRRATGASLVIGLVIGAGIFLVAMLLGGESRTAFLLLGVGMPALLLQDSWRFIFFAAGRPAYATVNDAAWTVAQLGLVGILIASGRPGIALLLAAWCFSGFVAAVLGLVQARAVPSLRAGLLWIPSTRDLSSRFLAEFAIGNGTSQILLWLVSLTAGVLAAGSLRAAQLLLGPPRVVVQAAYSAIVPEGVRLHRRHPHIFPLAVVVTGVTLAGANLIWGGLFIALPERVGHALLGESWNDARPLILILALAAAAFGAQTAAIAALRVMAAANRSLRARVIAAPVSLIVAIVGGAVDGARGAAIGIAAGSVFSAVITWMQWLAARRDLHQPNLSSTI